MYFILYFAGIVDGPVGGEGSQWSDGPSGSRIYLNGPITVIELNTEMIFNGVDWNWVISGVRTR